jgi:hypothetical protein
VFAKQTAPIVRHDEQDVRVPLHSVQHRHESRHLHPEPVRFLAHVRARMRQRPDQLARALVRRRSQVVRGLSGADVAIMRKAPSVRTGSSVALQAWANVARCLDRTIALDMMACTILDRACARQSRHAEQKGRARESWKRTGDKTSSHVPCTASRRGCS